ncbi:hypothetical protein RFI_27683 [Reticulomyxa filosa]|uniref:Helicase SMUBP-2/HCS1 1B domain-containing protein n=1 Tax=Reticulomyxa filosa TaxID=46433 RepID=X6M6Z3_RETFI|nr:hypothetical protein RFI_27683 [Reticulomyxa filosa]|eukprot:ETO09699.1 hypothetical protein RFI_27683 [Reticulomyxa filosa]
MSQSESPLNSLLFESLSSFISRTTKLLEIEKKDDIALVQEAQETLTYKQLSEQGICLRHVQCINIRTGLYGRTMCDFEVKTEHKFGVGDLIQVMELTGSNHPSAGSDPTKNDTNSTAIVSKNSSTTLQIVFEEPPNALQLGHRYTLMLLIDTM